MVLYFYKFWVLTMQLITHHFVTKFRRETERSSYVEDGIFIETFQKNYLTKPCGGNFSWIFHLPLPKIQKVNMSFPALPELDILVNLWHFHNISECYWEIPLVSLGISVMLISTILQQQPPPRQCTRLLPRVCQRMLGFMTDQNHKLEKL